MFDMIFTKCEQHVRLAKKVFKVNFVTRGIFKTKKTSKKAQLVLCSKTWGNLSREQQELPINLDNIALGYHEVRVLHAFSDVSRSNLDQNYPQDYPTKCI